MSAFSSKLPDGLQAVGLYAGILLAGAALVLSILHFTNQWRIKHGRSALMLEPLHLIVLGLLIALGGVGWQLMRGDKIPSLGKITQTGSTASLSDLEWGFERYPGYYFIGMSADAEKKILIHFFQAQGRNKTQDPIIRVHGYVRSDRTGQKYPIYFNLAGNRANEDEINPIPVDAIIDITAPFLPNDELMPVQQFLNEVVPFTFFFEYDSKTYRRTFTLEEIEPQIRKYEQEVRKSSVRPPQMSKKEVKQ